MPALISSAIARQRVPFRVCFQTDYSRRAVTFLPTRTASNLASFNRPTKASENKISARAANLAGHFPSSSTSPSIAMASLPISEKGYHSSAPSQYTTRKIGAANTLEHRVFVEKDGKPVSPFHDIPLYANETQTVLNMIVEVPRWTNAKMEVRLFHRLKMPRGPHCRRTGSQLNLVLTRYRSRRRRHSTRSSRTSRRASFASSAIASLTRATCGTMEHSLRYIDTLPTSSVEFQLTPSLQTWEDPNVVHPETKAKGDNDPLDVCEIGELVAKPGEVKQVKVLGVMALLDEEETDWKIIVIDVKDPLAPKLNDIEDVERHLPGLLRATNEWFRIYKIPDGKPENQFAFSGECKNKKYATDIVRECAEAWERLIMGKSEKHGVSLANVTVSHSPDRVDPSSLNIPKGDHLTPAPIDPSIDKWFFISGAPQ